MIERLLTNASRGSLRSYFERNDGRLMDKWMHYFDIYERHFSEFRGKRPTLLEIGVSHGGSLQMWRHYFGRRSTIIGVDIDERAKSLEEPGVHIVIGDQSDPVFLQSLADEFGPFDIVIDDGSHVPAHQLVSLKVLWRHVKVGGVYLVEDLHTNYWTEYGAGLTVETSFIEWVKVRIDDLNAWHSREATVQPNEWTKTVGGLHLYDSIAVLDRAELSPPTARMTGHPAFESLYGQSADAFIADEHRARLAYLTSPRARALRLLRHPIATTRRVFKRLFRSNP